MLDLLNDMGPKTRARPDIAIADLADRQHGVVSRQQLAALGIGAGAIQHRLANGRLHPVFRGVFAVGRSGLGTHGRWMAAVLSCGNRAMLSHRSAAALWCIAPYAGSSIEITIPGTRRRRRKGIRVHGGIVAAEDRSSHKAIAVTSVARTLMDLSAVVDSRRLARALEEAERLRLLDITAVEHLIGCNDGRRGMVPLRAALEALRPVPETRSALEREFVALCRDHGLPPPVMNMIVEGLEADAVWKRAGLVVELDGYAFHRTRGAFERDRARDARLLLAGYRVMRITARRLRDDPDSVVAAIRRLLAISPGELELSSDMR